MDKSFTPEMITPQWVALILIASLVLFCSPRKYVLPTFLVATAFLALENRAYILGLNFFTAATNSGGGPVSRSRSRPH
jgi:hypothetical protein